MGVIFCLWFKASVSVAWAGFPACAGFGGCQRRNSMCVTRLFFIGICSWMGVIFFLWFKGSKRFLASVSVAWASCPACAGFGGCQGRNSIKIGGKSFSRDFTCRQFRREKNASIRIDRTKGCFCGTFRQFGVVKFFVIFSFSFIVVRLFKSKWRIKMYDNGIFTKEITVLHS